MLMMYVYVCLCRSSQSPTTDDIPPLPETQPSNINGPTQTQTQTQPHANSESDPDPDPALPPPNGGYWTSLRNDNRVQTLTEAELRCRWCSQSFAIVMTVPHYRMPNEGKDAWEWWVKHKEGCVEYATFIIFVLVKWVH